MVSDEALSPPAPVTRGLALNGHVGPEGVLRRRDARYSECVRCVLCVGGHELASTYVAPNATSDGSTSFAAATTDLLSECVSLPVSLIYRATVALASVSARRVATARRAISSSDRRD